MSTPYDLFWLVTMRPLWLIISSCILLISVHTNATELSKVYKGLFSHHNATLTITPFNQPAHYLINFQSFGHKYDRQTLLYKKIWNSHDKNAGYHFKMAGLDIITVRDNRGSSLIHGSFVPYLEVNLANSPRVKVFYSGKADVTIEQSLLSDYQQRQGIKNNKADTQLVIKRSLEQFTKSCHQNTTLNIDWKAFEQADAKTTPAMLASYFESLTRLCAIDSDYLSAINTIHSIKVRPSKAPGQQHVSLTGSQLLIELDKNTANIREKSYQALYDML